MYCVILVVAERAVSDSGLLVSQQAACCRCCVPVSVMGWGVGC